MPVLPDPYMMVTTRWSLTAAEISELSTIHDSLLGALRLGYDGPFIARTKGSPRVWLSNM